MRDVILNKRSDVKDLNRATENTCNCHRPAGDPSSQKALLRMTSRLRREAATPHYQETP